MNAPRGRFGSVMISSKSGQQGDEFQNLQLVDVAPNSAPQATFLRLPNETCYDHSLYLQMGLSATQNLKQIRAIDGCLETMETLISKFYCRRSIMEPLQKFLNAQPEHSTALAQIARQYAEPLVQVVNDAIEGTQNASKQLHEVLSNKAEWSSGQYSTELLRKVCELVFKMFVLDKLRSSKTAVSFDLNALNQMMTASGASIVTPVMSKWLSDPDSIEKGALDALRVIPNDQLMHVGHVFSKYIRESLAVDQMLPELKYAMLVTLAFLVKLCPASFQATDVMAVKQLFEETPYVPLYHEFAINICEFVSKTDLFRSHGHFNEKPIQIPRMIGALRRQFAHASTRLHRATAANDKADGGAVNEIIGAAVEAISLIASTTGKLREQYAYKLAKPPAEPEEMKAYERSVRYGFKPEELKAMLQLVSLCRELSDLIRMNIPNIYPKICSSIQHAFQDIVKNVLEKTYVKCKRKKKALRGIIEQIRAASVDWIPGENAAVPAKKSEVKPRQIPTRAAAPSGQVIELVRIQLQHVLNPESRFLQASKKALKKLKNDKCVSDKQEKRLNAFLVESMNWVSLLEFEQSLARAADQSSFYFKEVHLDINHTMQFPVRSSLPFILCQFALENYGQPELTEVIFYPLSIYDDAAYVAVNKHKSRMMFDEIQAEARVCLDTLSVLIGEFTFNAFRTFASLRQLTDRFAAQLRVSHKRVWPQSRAYRLRTLLQQNQYYLLSKQVALKTLIGARVDQELNDAVARLYGVGQDFGVVASIAISKVSAIIGETHRLLVDQGLPMMPFKDIERTARWDNVLESFSSKYLRDVSRHLFKNVVRKFSLCLNPLRFIPPKKVQLPTDPLGKLILGRIMKEALESTVAFVTVEHFSVLMRQFSDGAIVLLVQSIHKHIRVSFEHFLEKYRDVCGRLSRIRDSPFGTSAHSAFTRYEGAYKFFLNDPAVLALLRAMQDVGNTFAIAELIDEALSLKQFNVVQVLEYLRSVDKEGNTRDELDRLFDQDFREKIRIITARPMSIAESSQQLLLSLIVNEFISLVQREIHTFEEPNAKSPDFTTMSGFASVWSVVEFVYCLMEATRVGEQDTGFPKYGSGVMLCAALILLAVGQDDLSRVLCVGRKMQRHKETDMSGVQDEKILRFLAVSQYDIATIDWALLFFRPYVRNFHKTQ